MSAKQITGKKKTTSKEIILKEIVLQLSQALTSLKEQLGEKKFDKRIKKAAKLLSDGIKSAAPKKMPAPKPAASPNNKEEKTKPLPPARKAAKKKSISTK